MLAIKDRYVGSLICLMLAGVCDMFDGTIASVSYTHLDVYKRQAITG